MSGNLGVCPVCGDVYTLDGTVCWRCLEQEMIDNDPNPPEPVDWDHKCEFCNWFLTISGKCVNPECDGKTYHPVETDFWEPDDPSEWA